jgi:hypothetical protein
MKAKTSSHHAKEKALSRSDFAATSHEASGHDDGSELSDHLSNLVNLILSIGLAGYTEKERTHS